METNPSTNWIALLAGATGLVGRECLRLLACDDRVVEVRALVRRPLPLDSIGLRVRECRTDFDQLHNHLDWFQVDRVFCALGTTIRQAENKWGQTPFCGMIDSRLIGTSR